MALYALMDKIWQPQRWIRVDKSFLVWAMLAPALLVGVDGMGRMTHAQQQNTQLPATAGTIEMKLRRLPDSVELVIEGAGAAPQLRQNTSGSTWQGLMITSSPNGLRRGPQRLSLPEAGLESVSIEGSGTTYRLSITPVPGSPLGRPVVSADGRNLILSFSAPNQPTLQTLSPNITTPGRVPQPRYVPPLQPRAVAPPVGDMAVGTMMLSNPSYVNVSGPSVTMTLKNAPAKDVLMAITRLGGYGFVFVDDPGRASGGGAQSGCIGPDAAHLHLVQKRKLWPRPEFRLAGGRAAGQTGRQHDSGRSQCARQKLRGPDVEGVPIEPGLGIVGG